MARRETVAVISVVRVHGSPGYECKVQTSADDFVRTRRGKAHDPMRALGLAMELARDELARTD